MNIFKKILLSFCLVTASFAVNASVVSLHVSDQNIQVGESFTVDLILDGPFDGLYDGDTLFGFGFNLNYDAVGLYFDGYTLASGWDDDSAFYGDTDIAASHFPGVDDLRQSDLFLTQFEFTALASGSFNIGVFTDSLASFNQGLFYLWESEIADFSGQTLVHVAAVSAPGSSVLLLFVFALMVSRMRKHQFSVFSEYFTVKKCQ